MSVKKDCKRDGSDSKIEGNKTISNYGYCYPFKIFVLVLPCVGQVFQGYYMIVDSLYKTKVSSSSWLGTRFIAPSTAL